MTDAKVFDAREIPLFKKLGAVMAEVQALKRGESFILINDIDPKPLRLRLGNSYTWEVLSSEKGEYRVRITRG